MNTQVNNTNLGSFNFNKMTPDQLNALESKCRQMRSEAIFAALSLMLISFGKAFDKIVKAAGALPQASVEKDGNSIRVPARYRLFAD